jgi:signal transduction histidine kinase
VAFPNGVKLINELRPVPPVLGDAEALSRVIQNLLTNAIQAVEGDGSVTLTVTHEGGNVIVSVADTGCGMSQEFIRESLFVPFRTTKRGGWGIGLYQVREIVESHGGAVSVSSRVGAGTTFWATLPAMNVEGPAPG